MILMRRSVLAGMTMPIVSIARAFAGKSRHASSTTKSTMKHVQAGDLNVAYLEQGPVDGMPVILLHGFPYDAHAYDIAAARLAQAGLRCLSPFLRGYGPTRFRSGDTFRSGQQAALGADLTAFMTTLGIGSAVLAGYDWGGRAACVVAALSPERVRGLVTCGTPYNIQNGATAARPIAPDAERRHWYWFYLNSERGRAALTGDRRGYCRALWADFSPTWAFDAAAFNRSAAAFDNPDFVAVVLHSYRYRIGAVAGDPRFEEVERRLSAEPPITVPTIALCGADDGVDPPQPSGTVTPRFTQLRRLTRLPSVGHNLPQEAPDAFAQAVLEVTK